MSRKTQKQCATCLITKPMSAFYRSATKQNASFRDCNPCRSAKRDAPIKCEPCGRMLHRGSFFKGGVECKRCAVGPKTFRRKGRFAAHVLEQVREVEKTAVCAVCGPTKVRLVRSKSIQKGKTYEYANWTCLTPLREASREQALKKYGLTPHS